MSRTISAQRVYRLHDFSKRWLIRPGVAYCVTGKVNSTGRLFLVVESVREDTKHRMDSIAPGATIGRGGPPAMK